MRTLLAYLLLGLAPVASAQKAYMGMYLQGSKIGYSSYWSVMTILDGKPVRESHSSTKLAADMLGSALQIDMKSVSWTDRNGRPVKMKFNMTSSGRTQRVDAVFAIKKAILNIDNSGTKDTKTLDIPDGAPIVDDPIPLVLAGNPARSFYVLDPTTVSFVKNDIKMLGKQRTEFKGKFYDATAIEVVDPRASTTIYLTSKGDFLKAIAPMGIEMFPVTKAEALGNPGRPATVDLATATSIRTDKPLNNPTELSRLKLRFTGRDMSRIPSDSHQTVTGSGQTWVVDIHPLRLDAGISSTIEEAKREKPAWTKPSLNIPSDAPRFRKLAEEVTEGRRDVRTAALRIREYVHGIMRPNAGIGVLRDANDVLDTKEGVCRDYAILTATLCRAAGIPTRLVSGLVNWDGTFYYHAWVEVWDGARWLGIDSTGNEDQISAAHVKLADGNVEEAFTFTFLEKVKVNVLDLKRG